MNNSTPNYNDPNYKSDFDKFCDSTPKEEVSLCGICQCMTHTVGRNCGKCGCLKPDSTPKHLGDVAWCECECHTKGSPQPECEKCYADSTPSEGLDIWKLIHDSEDYSDPQFYGIDEHKLYSNIEQALSQEIATAKHQERQEIIKEIFNKVVLSEDQARVIKSLEEK